MKTKVYTQDEVRAVKPQAHALLAEFPVVGVGITRIGEGYGLKVNLSEKVTTGQLPETVAGVPIQIEVVGTIAKRL